MTFWLENPWMIAGLGALLAVGLGAGWYHTGQLRLLKAAAAVLALTGLGVLLERYVQTEREQVIAAVREMAADLQAGNVEDLVAHVHSSQETIREQVHTYMRYYRFRRVSIKRTPDVAVALDQTPPKAVAAFNVVLEEETTRQIMPQFVVLTLLQEDGAWRVFEVEHFPPNERISAQDRLR